MSDTATAVKTKAKIKLPRQWKAVMMNDDYTPMDFVVQVLISIFEKTEDEAVELMRAIHNHGRAIVYTGPLELVRQKVDDTRKLAQQYQFEHFRVVKEEA